MRGTTEALARGGSRYEISIHVPREGDDWRIKQYAGAYPHISIHVPREGDDESDAPTYFAGLISIHVPREGDDAPKRIRFYNAGISIHVPREGDDGLSNEDVIYTSNFNPRPP